MLIVSCATSLFAQESQIVLPPLTVTGLRGSVMNEYFAGNATTIDEVAIRKSGVRSIAELLESQAGVRITSTMGDRARGEIALRGFGENASSRTLLLLDGRPLNRPDMAAVNLQEISLARVARVEVLRGSQTARFGDNAVGGVINIVTQQAQEKPWTRVETSVGSNDWWMGRWNHASTLGGTQMTVDGEVNHDGGWRENSQSESRTISLGISRKMLDQVRMHSSFSYNEQEGFFPGPLTTEQFRQNPRQSIYSGNFPEQYGSEQVSYRADFVANIDKTTLGNIEIPLSWNRRNLNWNMGPGAHADTILDSIVITPVVRQSDEKWSLEQGLDLRVDRLGVDLFRDFARTLPRSESTLQRATIAPFTFVDVAVGNDLHWQSAARAVWKVVDASLRDIRRPNDPQLNFDRTQRESNAALQSGIRWEADEQAAWWLRYDLLYRLPSMDEMAAYQGFPLSQPFNDQLEAEKGHNWECGAEWRGEEWLLKANAYAQWIDGEILYDFVKNLNVNFADTRRLGGEVEIKWEGKFFTAGMIYQAVDARFSSGTFSNQFVPLVPRHGLTSSLEIRPYTHCSLRLEHLWQSAAPEGNDFANTQRELPAYQIMNLTWRHQVTDDFSWHVRMTNFWDEDYATLKYSGVWFPAAGRQIQIGMHYDF